MIAFEGVAALALLTFGRFAPGAKAEATASLKDLIATASPELAQRIVEAEQLQANALSQFTGKGIQ